MKFLLGLGLLLCIGIHVNGQSEMRVDSSRYYQMRNRGNDSVFFSKAIYTYDEKNSTKLSQTFVPLEVEKAIEGKTRLSSRALYKFDEEGREIERVAESFPDPPRANQKRLFKNSYNEYYREGLTYDYDGKDSSLSYLNRYYFFDGKSTTSESFRPENGTLKLVNRWVYYGSWPNFDSTHTYQCDGAAACSLVGRSVLELFNDSMNLKKTYSENGGYYISLTRYYGDTLTTHTAGRVSSSKDSFRWSTINHTRIQGARTEVISGFNPAINPVTGYPLDLKISTPNQRTIYYPNEKEGRTYSMAYKWNRGKWEPTGTSVTYSSVVVNSIDNSALFSPSLKVHPNPVTHVLNIEAPTGIDNIKVFATNGQLLLECDHCENQLDVRTLDNGVYILQAKSEGIVSMIKFVKSE